MPVRGQWIRSDDLKLPTCSRRLINGPSTGYGVPRKPISGPYVEVGRERFGIVEAARHNVNAIWPVIIAVNKRRATTATEAARHMRRRAEFDGLAARERESIGRKYQEGERRGGRCLAARAAVTDAAGIRLSLNPVPDGRAEASAFVHDNAPSAANLL
jgi:hypothetical protein